jgi:NADPH-dependent curcumin reductase CurA
MNDEYRRIVLASRPQGWASEANFRLEYAAHAPLAEGQVRVRVHYLSLDPYMRGRMNDVKSYAAPQALDATMGGGTVGEVVESRHARFQAGDHVRGMLGWTEYGVSDAADLSKVDAAALPLQAYLGAAGMTGMTAWYGYHKICAPRAGETLVVSAASGAVGGIVGQLAHAAGVRVIGIAGGAQKCRYVQEELGFDACIDYKAAPDLKSLTRTLAAAAPNGVDALFENVGGDCLNASMALLNPFARVAICGLISDYNAAPGEPMQSAIRMPVMFLVSRFRMQGFIVSDHMDLWPQGLGELAQLVAAGRLKYRETISQGLASAPAAFIGLLQGANFGKQLVRLV